VSLGYIHHTYGLTVRRGSRVLYSGGPAPQLGTVQGARGAHLMFQLDGERYASPLDPSWELRVLGPEDLAGAPRQRAATNGE
jgi:hypothetical protein